LHLYKLLRLLFGQLVYCKLKQLAGTGVFFLPDFKLCKCRKQGFCLEGSATQLSDPTLVKKPSALIILLVLFKFGCLDVAVGFWCLVNKPLKDSPAVV
jgi:hypothetical protein